MTQPQAFWPGGERLAVSVPMQFEAGGQPISGAGGPITEPILDGFPDLGQNTFYEYGVREGVPRILDLMDKHQVKMTSFMIGDAVRAHRRSPPRSSAAATRPARTVAAGSGSTSCPARRKPNGSRTVSRRSKRP